MEDDAFDNYINNLGDNENEITENDLTKEELRVVNEAFEDDEL